MSQLGKVLLENLCLYYDIYIGRLLYKVKYR